jgi:hypothetical protein
VRLDFEALALTLAVLTIAAGIVVWPRGAGVRNGQQVRWTETLRGFLETHAHFRRWTIILTTVVSPVALAVLSVHDLLPITKDQALGAMVALAVAGVLFGALLAFTEQTSGEISARAGELDVQLREAAEALRLEKAARQEEAGVADREMDRLAALAGLRERLFGYLVLDHAKPSDSEREVLIWLLTNELAALGPQLFDWEAPERWSVAVYLRDEAQGDLFCAADFRNHSNDFGEGHRRWGVGLGMVGITFRAGRELVLSDAESSDLTEVMRDPDDQQADEDRSIYRSVAAVPIFKPEAYSAGDTGDSEGAEDDSGAPPLFGVVVATSDMPMRFTADGEDRLAPLRALADAVGMVLMTGELKRPLRQNSPQTETAPEDGRDGDDEAERSGPEGPSEPEGPQNGDAFHPSGADG